MTSARGLAAILIVICSCGPGRDTSRSGPAVAAAPAVGSITAQAAAPIAAGQQALPITPTAALRAIAPAPEWLTASIDSCVKQRWQSDDTALPADSLLAHLAGSVRDFGKFAIYVPDQGKVFATEDAKGFTVEWPDCPLYCRFVVSIGRDSTGKGVEGIVAALVAEQRRIDSVNRDPNRSVGEFDELGAPPIRIRTPTAVGYEIDDACGDCAATRLLFGRNSDIVTVSMSADAMPGAARHMCTMSAAARSFQWPK